MAARAAGEQDLYWEYHDAMYRDAPERGHLKITDKKIMDWANEIGVPDLEQFEKDSDSPELRAKVDADTREARRVGATGTPTFLIGRDLIVGAQPTEAFQQAIDEQLEALEDS
ncbi:DsbA family protein [Janibacter limosus]|nr:DsbA family protein [Janibacter limosus]